MGKMIVRKRYGFWTTRCEMCEVVETRGWGRIFDWERVMGFALAHVDMHRKLDGPERRITKWDPLLADALANR